MDSRCIQIRPCPISDLVIHPRTNRELQPFPPLPAVGNDVKRGAERAMPKWFEGDEMEALFMYSVD